MSKVCKDEFIKELSRKYGIQQTIAATVLNDSLALLTEHIQNGDTVMFTGFGSFSIQEVKPKKGRNLQTGETIDIPAKRKVKFQASESITESLQRKKIDLTKH